jgi:Domain of unknown function (DUF3805)
MVRNYSKISRRRLFLGITGQMPQRRSEREERRLACYCLRKWTLREDRCLSHCYISARDSPIFAAENFAMEEYNSFEIEDCEIFFQYPEWWEHRLEENNTYLFWDEYVGSFRITPLRLKKGGPNLQQFLADRRASTTDAESKTIGRHSFVVSQQDDNQADGGATRLHYYIGGHGSVAIVCSYAYGLALLEDEFNREAVEAGLEEVEILLEGLRFGDEEE